MCSGDLNYDDDLSMYVDEDGNAYYDSEGREPYGDDD